MNKLLITLVQSSIVWENPEENFCNWTDKIDKISAHTHIIVLPETFNTGFSMNPLIAEPEDGPTLQWMKATAAKKKSILCGTLFMREDDKIFNRLVWMQPDGKYYFYNKRHLFSYANEHQFFHAGENKVVVQVGTWKIRLNICYDLRFPVWNRQDKSNAYDVNLIVANWPDARIEAWDTLLKARAIENMSYVVACNRVGEDASGIKYSGHSQIIDPMGKQLCFLKEDEHITYELDKALLETCRARFSFLNDADDFVII